MADIIFNPVTDWFDPDVVLDINDPLLAGKIRLSTFQVVYDDDLPLFFRIAEAPDAPYVNMKKFITLVSNIVTSPEDGTNKRIKTIHVSAGSSSQLTVEYLDENN